MEVTLCFKNAFIASIVLFCSIIFLSNRMRSGKGNKQPQIQPEKALQGRSPFNILYDPEVNIQNAMKAEVDVIAVHGLGSNVDRTWTWYGTNESQKPVNWLKDADMLPSKIPTGRILAFNYESKWFSDAPRTRVELCGEELIQSLHRLRKESDRPIIFIAHSLGGLVVQDALLYAQREKGYNHILQHTKGIISLGTPFRGTKFYWAAKLVARIMHFAGSHSHILSLLAYDNHKLRDKEHYFGRLRKDFQFPISCFFELNRTQLIRTPLFSSLFKGMVVEESSAWLTGEERLPLHADHISLNKYSGHEDRSFINVSGHISKMCENAITRSKEGDRNLTPSHTDSIAKVHWVVPFDQNEGFVGRDNILPNLLQRISPDFQKNTCQRLVIEGLGGTGKSQVALEAAFRLRRLEPQCSIFWVPVLSTTSFEDAYHKIAEDLGIQYTDGESNDVVSTVKQALSSQEMGKWLLIVDNADDPSLMFWPGSLTSHLPSSPQGSILFTTRTSEVTSRLDICCFDTFRIEEMSPKESMDLMGTRLSRLQMEDVESLHALLKLLCYLPLALKQAAAYMQLHRLTPKDYIDRCQPHDERLIRLLSRDFSDRTRYDDAKHPVAKTWLISFMHLSSNNPRASQYLQFMSFLSEKNIPLSILPAEDELDAKEAVDALQAYGFITTRKNKDFVDMHRLVKLAIRNWLHDKKEDSIYYGHVQNRMLVLFQAAERNRPAEWARYIPHGHSVINDHALSASGEATWSLLTCFSRALLWRGLWKTALDLNKRAQDLDVATTDPSHPEQVRFNLNYTVSLIHVGLLDEAESFLREAMEAQAQTVGEQHPDTLNSKQLLALIQEVRGQYKDSEQLNREVLQAAESVLGKEHERTLRAANSLCNSLLSFARYKDAEELARQSLVKSRVTFGNHHLRTFETMSLLASSLRGLQQHPEAEDLGRQVTQATEEVLGIELPETFRSDNTLALTLCGLGQFSESQELHRNNLQIFSRIYGEDGMITILYMFRLGYCLRQAGEHQHATDLMQRAVKISSKTLGETLEYTTSCLKRLGLIPNEVLQEEYDPSLVLIRIYLTWREFVPN